MATIADGPLEPLSPSPPLCECGHEESDHSPQCVVSAVLQLEEFDELVQPCDVCSCADYTATDDDGLSLAPHDEDE